MDNDFFEYLVVTDQLDEFLGFGEKETEKEITNDSDQEELEAEDDYEE